MIEQQPGFIEKKTAGQGDFGSSSVNYLHDGVETALDKESQGLVTQYLAAIRSCHIKKLNEQIISHL